MVRKIIIVLLFLAVPVFAQDSDKQKAKANIETALEQVNETNSWSEFIETGKTKIPNAVKRKLAPNGFKIIQGQKVMRRYSNKQQRAIKR